MCITAPLQNPMIVDENVETGNSEDTIDGALAAKPVESKNPSFMLSKKQRAAQLSRESVQSNLLAGSDGGGGAGGVDILVPSQTSQQGGGNAGRCSR